MEASVCGASSLSLEQATQTLSVTTFVASQAPLATAEELGAAHEAAFVERFLGGDVTTPDMRAIGLPWSSSLATYCRCGVASAGSHWRL